jgi:uncharacterized RDD family membrane protein YckC
MYCHKCGGKNDDQAAFCDKCGVALQKPTPETGATVPAYPATVQYAGFRRRVAATGIDGLIWTAIEIVSFVVLFAVGVVDTSDAGADPGTAEYAHYTAVSLVFSAAMFAAYMAYFAIMESSSKQATLGKMVLGIVVTDNDGKRISLGRAIGRNLGKIVSSIILFIGYLMVAFTEKKQGLHDIMANCLVVVKR